MKKKTVLFLCTGNSARSQMAEALLRNKAANQFDVFSAGTSPEHIDSRAIEAIARFGIDASDLVSKHLHTFAGKHFDYVITLCDKANNECRSYPGAAKQLAWDFPDPKNRAGDQPFFSTLRDINNRLTMFLLVEQQATEPMSLEIQTSLSTSDFSKVDPIAFYKCLTDDIRLKSLMLTHYHGELCVCELMEALNEESQPKVSRNLALLKKAAIISDRKHGQWVFYRINPNLPLWAKSVIAETTENNLGLIMSSLQQLDIMQNRPNKVSFCR
ncbi:metalloregulator ArsR/SmtB family transcription factor [Shewanella sp. BF02_Schw]|jgi:protein-tyrosine-phosphatase/DNA-binding transcriptional ArsR family regulator|uniref:metalloregulator ArsR/SmtB family transcription factor n=1 Tax=Shewanella sp. BF02_Schw TaxID=394908 RepID=UPI001782E527|nr:metalloregulator ArsR/SmtB family transcription factor [Shewanella sp. BF02_Schw]MBO1897805.1 metalloregulator ArsR/SmtB family transcription factor [Shewanella sp. BF02_Schw]